MGPLRYLADPQGNRSGPKLKSALRAAMLYGTKGIYAILIFVSGILVARAFGADGFGQYSLFLTTLAIAIPVGSLGGNYSMIEWVPKLSPREMRVYAGQMLGTVALISIGTILVVCSVLAWYGSALWALGWLVLPATLRVVLSGYLQARSQQVAAAVIDSVILPFLLFTVLWVAIQTGLNLRPALAFALGISYTAAMLLCVFLLREHITLSVPSVEILRRKSHRRSLIVYAVTALLAPILSQIDRYFLIGLRDGATLGPYAAAQNLMNLVVYGMTAAVALILPSIAAGLAGKQSIAQMVNVCKRFARAIFALSATASILTIFFGKPVLALFSPDFTSAHESLVLLTLGLTVSLIFGFPSSVLTMSNHRAMVIYSMIFSVVTTILACIALIPQYGAFGAAIANVLGMVTNRAICHILLIRRCGFNVAIL